MSPTSVHEGALDWMGMAHMLGEPGARPELSEAFGRAPLLRDEQVLLFGWGPEQATEFERRRSSAAASSGSRSTRSAPTPGRRGPGPGRSKTRRDRLLVHFDVDVVDFTDSPLSENTGRNEGLAFEPALRALRKLLASPKLAALTITELNPVHAEEGSEAIGRLVAAVAAGLGPVSPAACGPASASSMSDGGQPGEKRAAARLREQPPAAGC